VFVAETSHAISCPHGAFPTIRHNNIRDFTALLLSEVCHDFKVEHYLQPLTGENLRYKTGVCDDNPCLDIRPAGFWSSHHQHAFFYLHLFNSLAPSNKSSTLSAAYHKHDQEKHCAYEEEKWSMTVLLPWFFQLLVEWEKLLLLCTNV